MEAASSERIYDFPSSKSVVDLPSELVEKIFLFLQVWDLVSLCKTCSRFRTVIMEHDHIWHKLCYKDFGDYITSIQGWTLSSYRDFYASVLHQFGPILGIWNINLQYYGGLIHIHVNNGRIIAEQCLVPIKDHLCDPLRIKPFFELTINSSGELITRNLTDFHQRGEEGTIKIDNSCCSRRIDQFSFICHCNKEYSTEETDEEEQFDRERFRQWVREEYGDELYLASNPHLIYNTIQKFRTMTSALQKPLQFKRIQLPLSTRYSGCTICPGIYKGTYSSHGIELISVTTSEENILGMKITGDPNVPAGEMTFDINLNEKLQEEEGHGTSRYPFDLPQDYLENLNAPSHYTSRYKGFGQIAGPGFQSPRRSPVIMYTISNTEFGLLWVDLHCFAMFSPTKEDFLQ